MKNCLSIEQSAELIKRGVSNNKASARLYDQTVPQKQMKARVKATGEIVDVCFSPTNCMETGGKRWWKTLELEFPSLEFPETINPLPPTEMCDKFPPMEMYYDPQTMTARVIQNMCFRINQEVVDNALKIATDKQLRDELKRRADARKALRSEELRCRHCKHCIEGYTSKRSFDYGCKTSVCGKKLKFQCEAYALYYATRHTQKACDMFELK